MFQQFLKNIEDKKLILKDQKVLLAVSGGIDSMVMLYLFEKSGFEYGVVHCNFQLRGDDSDSDEDLVRRQVLVHGVPAWFKKFDTQEYAQINGISIEMAARELRYSWFSEIRKENNYNFVATAHHADDQIETFFLNLIRKTGIKGLTGIREKTQEIIRPLLFASRADIEKFASENYIEFREDSTNAETVYQRNYIRNRIIPDFERMNPAFRKNVSASIDNLKDAEAVYVSYFEQLKPMVVGINGDVVSVDIRGLLKTEFPETFLMEILSEYGFSPIVANDIFNGLNGEPGTRFYSKSHRLIKDREKLFITKSKEETRQLFYVETYDKELREPLHLKITRQNTENFKLRKEAFVACVDEDKLEFPLLIRRWQQGDYFQPFGMPGFKKVSDFFIDEKIPVHEKEKTWLLCSGEKIVWIMGLRTDDRFKISPKSRRIIMFEIL